MCRLDSPRRRRVQYPSTVPVPAARCFFSILPAGYSRRRWLLVRSKLTVPGTVHQSVRLNVQQKFENVPAGTYDYVLQVQ